MHNAHCVTINGLLGNIYAQGVTNIHLPIAFRSRLIVARAIAFPPSSLQIHCMEIARCNIKKLAEACNMIVVYSSFRYR